MARRLLLCPRPAATGYGNLPAMLILSGPAAVADCKPALLRQGFRLKSDAAARVKWPHDVICSA